MQRSERLRRGFACFTLRWLLISGSQEGYMAPKPEPARFVFTVFTVGMVLVMALTILTITADRDLAAPSAPPIYHPQLPLLY